MKGGRGLSSAAAAWWPWSSSRGRNGFSCSCSSLQQKLMMVTKAPDRSAVHGTRPPVTRTINIEEVEEEINKGKEDKEKKIEDIQKRIDHNDSNQQSNDNNNVENAGGSSNSSSSSHSTN